MQEFDLIDEDARSDQFLPYEIGADSIEMSLVTPVPMRGALKRDKHGG